ncbi:nuclear transport factor 2 family protein [Nocardia sp. BMG51109]|uniref:nuclear transport factor 2 family protein n=1 Tax=Nocardia sp. BMG51109 TaxID=1056816 RepID=UPI0004655FF2|nr:nuclear transport factor 2 family protein [Nocardia sp. BMG51109]
MAPLPAVDVDTDTVAAIHQLYARQSWSIDAGAASEWAATFTPDGEFHSPTYPDPVAGAAALTEFAAGFDRAARAAGERHRHVLSNLLVDRIDADTLAVAAYLQVVATRIGGESRLLRFTTITDRLTRRDGGWLITRRVVERDDAPR